MESLGLSEFTFSSIMAGLTFGALGWWLIQQGRKAAHIPHVLLGLALMVFPYFITGDWLPWFVGAGLLGVAYSMR